MRILARILGGFAVLLVLFLLGGIFLPGTWAVRRSTTIDAPPEVIYPRLDAPARWDEWTSWEDLESTFEGPARGEGASRRWGDDRYGSGTFTIVEATEPHRLRYRVVLEDGAMRTDGELVLEPGAGGTVVIWRESGDFGWNPLMGYVALTMDRRQGQQLEEGLRRLKALVEAGDDRRPSRSSGGPGR